MFRIRFAFLFLGMFLLYGCGPQQLSTSLSSLNDAKTKVAFIHEQGSAFKLFIAHSENIDQLAVCFGEIVDCQKDNTDSVLIATRVGAIGEKSLFKIRDPIRYDGVRGQIKIHVATDSTFQTAVLRTLLFTSGTQPDDITAIPLIPENGKAGSFKLAMPRVHQQGATNYCWAYASFHTLRTYFIHNRPKNANYGKWKTFVETHDDSSKFASFMRATFQNSAGNTYRFVRGLRNVVGLPAAFKWAGESDGSHLKKVIAKLHQGQPTPFCDGRHCTSIYGYETNGQSPTYFYIADSSAPGSKGLIKRSVQNVLNNNFYPFYMNPDDSSENETSLLPEVPEGWENRPETFGYQGGL